MALGNKTHLKPPAHAAVFCVDEKSAIQALDRRDPVLPLSPGRAERDGFEYFRHGTLSLYAALEVSRGEVLGKTTQRHTKCGVRGLSRCCGRHTSRGQANPRHRRQPFGAQDQGRG
jgi:hypothetical protein